MSVERLRQFLTKLEAEEYIPSKEQIEALGADLVLVAGERLGYSGLVWQAGVYLLILASEHPDIGVERFYQKYGYDAVAAALEVSSISF